MRKFVINVNGNNYEVAVEEITEGGSSTSYAAPAPVAAPTVATTPAPAAKAPKKAKTADTGKSGSIKIESPMPGSIFDIKVAVGQEVKQGDVVLILEAMKMENEIMAPQDGKVSSIVVNKGDAVDTGDALVTME
ncbi:MAG TPA: biotin/lipoyl-containing protein [Bacillota bacterium]|nr:biotin/lipoyl-containing protein [Bacillota bacterium]